MRGLWVAMRGLYESESLYMMTRVRVRVTSGNMAYSGFNVSAWPSIQSEYVCFTRDRRSGSCDLMNPLREQDRQIQDMDQ